MGCALPLIPKDNNDNFRPRHSRILLLGVLAGLSADLNDEEAGKGEEASVSEVDCPSSSPGTSQGVWLPVILGAGVQENPPLGCSGSPRSKGSRGRGLNSRLGREEASRTLQERKALSTRAPSSSSLQPHEQVVMGPGWPSPKPSIQSTQSRLITSTLKATLCRATPLAIQGAACRLTQ